VFWLLFWVLSFLPSAFAAEEAERVTTSVRSFDLRRGAAAEQLEAFSDQAGVPLVFLVEELRGVRTNRLRGRFSISEALERLLVGTGLVAVRDERTDTFVISRRGALAQPHTPNSPKTMKRSNPVRFFAGLFAAIAIVGPTFS